MPVPARTGWLHLAWVYDPTGKLAYLSTTNSNFLFTINGVPQPIPAFATDKGRPRPRGWTRLINADL